MSTVRDGEYVLLDEPRPGAWGGIVVQPMWPLLAAMFAGGAASWIWSSVNSIALGSPTKRKEILLAVVGVAGAFVLAGGLISLCDARILPLSAIKYGVLVLTVWKLGIAYWIYFIQSRTFGIYQYYGGRERSGFAILLVLAFATRSAFGSLLESSRLLILYLVVS